MHDIFGTTDKQEEVTASAIPKLMKEQFIVVQELCSGGTLYDEMKRRAYLDEVKAV